MPYVEPSEVSRVKEIDLLSYLQQYEPDELVKLGNNSYSTATHDSLKISNGKWFWWSQGIGGRSALDYLIKVRGMTFLDAVNKLGAKEVSVPRQAPKAVPQSKVILLPKLASSNDAAIDYLTMRKIEPSITRQFINNGLIYTTERYSTARVVFVGKDDRGKPCYAFIRSTADSFRGEAPGSDKQYAFRWDSQSGSDTVHVFEGAIDMLSYATLAKESGTNWQELNLLSLGGVTSGVKLPSPLVRYLDNNPNITTVRVHMDNDKPGIQAAEMLLEQLTERGFKALLQFPPEGKDMSEYLMYWHNKNPSEAKRAYQSRNRPDEAR